MNQTEAMIKAFLKSGKKESDKIELDNLDWARLVRVSGDEVKVRNEHGTLFSPNELSNEEVRIFNTVV